MDYLLDFIDTSLDELDIPIVSSAYKVIKSGVRVIQGEEQTQFNEFKKNIRKDVKKLVNDNLGYKGNIKNVLNAFKKFYEEGNALITYFNRNDALCSYIKNHLSCSEEIDEEIIDNVVDIIFKNFEIIIPAKDWLKYIALNTDEIKSSITGLPDKIVHMISELNVKSDNTQVSETDNKIKDDNEEFAAKYNNWKKAQLFLDNDKNIILLEDVYVDPLLKNANVDINEKLKGWAENPSSLSREYTDAHANVLLLCGKAGIGKTSLVAKLISENFFNDRAHAIFLRTKKDSFDSYEPWESIKRAFNCENDDCYNDTILILDGFDELCVLKGSSFDGHKFLMSLSEFIPTEINVKILITSRENNGYFSEVFSRPGHILVENIMWSEKALFAWCDKYASKRNDKIVNGWISKFKQNYSDLSYNLKEIFCVPIIIYICCHENIDVSDNKSIAKIYDEAFKNIATREYAKIGLPKELKISDEEGAVILWQLAKEIAYQMYLHKTLESAANTELIKSSKLRVKAIKNRPDIEDGEYDAILTKMLNRLPAVFHFSSGNSDGGIEFAHKTVGEYFTAVKIYEDYFAEFDSNFFENSNIEALEKVWGNIIEAFRYKSMPNEILQYLNEMTEPIYNGKKDISIQEKKGFEYKKFEGYYIEGMVRHILSYIPISRPIKEYNVGLHSIASQICCAFRNLTWFLTGHGYCNRYDIEKCKEIWDLISAEYSDFNLEKWNLNNVLWEKANLSKANLREVILIRASLLEADLSKADLFMAKLESAKLKDANLNKTNLSQADLTGADLERANLKNVNLKQAVLRGTVLQFADFKRADLRGADLKGADLRGADLREVDLRDTDLREADLNLIKFNQGTLWYNAKYCLDSLCETKFSNDFEPQKYGMIEVDKEGNPVVCNDLE